MTTPDPLTCPCGGDLLLVNGTAYCERGCPAKIGTTKYEQATALRRAGREVTRAKNMVRNFAAGMAAMRALETAPETQAQGDEP